IHEIVSYENANQVAIFHSFIPTASSYIMWICTYAYIRPFREWKFEAIFNKIAGVAMIILFILHCYPLYHRSIYTLLPEQIDGRWMFVIDNDSPWLTHINLVTITLSSLLVILFISDIIRTRRRVFFKSILIASYFLIPFLFIYFAHSNATGVTNRLPNLGLIVLTHATIVSWFCSDYRLFQNSFTNAIQDVLNSVADLTVYTNMRLQVQFANTITRNLFNQNKISTTVPRLLAQYSSFAVSDIEQQLDQLNQKQIDKLEIEIDVEHQKYYLIIQSEPFFRASQQIGYIFIMNNVTELRHNQALLEQSNQTKDQLFAIIGHDLRKPSLAFRGISKKVNYLLERNDFDTLRQLGDSWENAANALNHLIDNLLNWALQQRGILPHQPKIIELHHAIKNSLEPLQGQLLDKNIELILRIPTHTKVLADFDSLVTIMRNVLDNAIKFTPPYGQIAVTTFTTKADVQIRVQDSGIGMDTQALSELFSIRKGKSRRGTIGESGTGIGLNLVHELVLLNQGTVSAESQPQSGTTVYITLPKAA
ncbi:MAG: HAMP domain-containing sensor histidine kinase, partial [Bacteroidota bacterium]